MAESLFKPAFQRLLDEPDDSLRQLRADPGGFAAELINEGGDPAPPSSSIPSLASLAFAVLREDGSVVHEILPDWWPADLAFADLAAGLPESSAAPRVFFLHDAHGSSVRAVCARAAEAVDWNLPSSVRETLLATPQGRILLCVDVCRESRALRNATASFRLSGLQQRAVLAVIGTGSAREAADTLGVSYVTVRQALSEAAHRVRAPNLPALVRRVVETSFGILPNNFDAASELAGWLPLTARQCQICELIAEGISREATAQAMRMSTALVKKELEHIFSALGIETAADLARIWAEAQALRVFSMPTEGPLGFFDPAIEPTHFLPRSDDRQVIAWSDYGPASGKPVLIVHSNWTCRSVPRPLVMRLQAAGWRPIAIDRPGFGSTHPGRLATAGPHDQAVEDTLAVLDRLKIDRIPVIARRAAQFATVLKSRLGPMIGPVLLVSPSPPTTEAGVRVGIVGVIKEAFYRTPQLIEFYFRLVTPQLSLERMEKLTRSICQGSPPDEALCDDPQFIRDRFRAIRPFSTGNLRGAIVEERLINRGLVPLEPLAAEECVIVHGRHDNHYSFEEATAYWSQVWPRAQVLEVADGGQFMTSSHPALLVDLLDGLVDETQTGARSQRE